MSVWGFGIVQTQELERAGSRVFEELCLLLSEAAGTTLRPVVAQGHRDLADSVESGDVALAWLPPIMSIELETRGITTVLAIPARNGTTTYHSALIVRKGGPRSIAELRGRRAVWVQRDSAAGYIVPRMNLASQGIDVLRYFMREMFVHSHPGVIDAVVSGEADVGATYCHVEAGTSRVIRGAWVDDAGRPLRPIEVLSTFGPIPNDALVCSNDLSATARAGLARAILDASPRVRDLFTKLLGSGDFRVPSAAHFDSLKHTLRAARARGHDANPNSSRMAIRVARKS
ncbi:MAG: phosphate/phosphite/phosphonate ABC transporter substrate-binding protein [Labilithrix sp.]|nr:phosphate/phosphite/phosphonate ABC transporter substrate-binding protein [Labilithrix sp.]MCW5812819.1 phosphate/phosphite/phosphonate ABC transporter substrate-binding protein [Labilithrix sp.]